MSNDNLDQVLKSAAQHPPEYLYYLLGGEISGSAANPQSAGDLAEKGRQFFAQWHAEFQKVICGRGGIYDQFVKGMVSKKDLPKAMAVAIMTGAGAVGGRALTDVGGAYLALILV